MDPDPHVARCTPFPALPIDVVSLAVHEFTSLVSADGHASFEDVCSRFGEDANRALVGLIRSRALAAWRCRPEVAVRLVAVPDTSLDCCAVAASFGLNDQWEFDTETFWTAVEARHHHRMQISRPDDRPRGC